MREEQSDLRAVSREFKAWRRRKTNARCRIPESLWREAAGVCENHSIGRVRAELGLNLNQLKAKVEQFKEEEPTFVSVEVPVPKTLDPVCEWVRPDGARLRIRIQAGAVDQLVKSFLGGRT